MKVVILYGSAMKTLEELNMAIYGVLLLLCSLAFLNFPAGNAYGKFLSIIILNLSTKNLA